MKLTSLAIAKGFRENRSRGKFIKRLFANQSIFGVILGLLITFIGFQNCSKVEVADLQSSSPVIPLDTSQPAVIVPIVDSQKSLLIQQGRDYFCSPMGSVQVPSNQSGIRAQLRYIDSNVALNVDEKNRILAIDYFQQNESSYFTPVSGTVYLSDINTPTRKFTSGFSTPDQKTIKNNRGETLIEYFALKMETLIKLGPDDPEGYYELSTVSDDGSVVQIYQNGQWVDLIQNDGPHSTRMGCSKQRLFFSKQTLLPVRMFYNQGPRTEIANVLLWNYRGREMNSSPTFVSSDSEIRNLCGVASRTDFWNPENSQPGKLFSQLSETGWKVLTPHHFQLPDNEVNPCSFNKYDLQPKLETQDGQQFRLRIAEKASVSLKLYQVSDEGLQLKQEVQSGEMLDHQFNLLNLDENFEYKIEVIFRIEEKKISVLTEYFLSFDQNE